MGKLMKYEFKKALFSKYVILAFTVLAEIVFLIGVFSKKETVLAWGICGLVLVALIGLFYIGIESIITMHQDLNTKQSYLLFLTPNSCFKILGAKVLQNGFAVLLAGLIFGILAVVDFSVMVIYMDGVQELLDVIQYLLSQIQVEIHITTQQVFLGLFGALSSWLGMIMNGYLAVVLAATFLAGRKLSGLVSFLMYFVLTILEARLLHLLPDFSTFEMQMWAAIGENLVLIVLAYVVTGWIMERKLNV